MRGLQLEEMESEDLVNDEVSVKGGCGECRRCLEMENEITKVNQKYQLLELEIEEKKNVIERLEGKLGFMELKKLKFEDEDSVLSQSNDDLGMSIQIGERVAGKKNVVVDLTADDEEDKITKLMIENSVLECEKKKAECEIDGWKVKYKELEIQLMELQKRLLAEMSNKGLNFPDMDSANLSGKSGLNPFSESLLVQKNDGSKSHDDDNVTLITPPGYMSSKKYTSSDEMKGSHQREFNVKYGGQVRKCLNFTEYKNPLKSFSPSTPGGRPPVDAIDISDSDDNLDAPNTHLPDLELTGRKVALNFTDDGLGNAMYENKLTSKARCAGVLEHQSEEEDVACYNGNKPSLLTPKRRRVSKVVTSDDESDDNIPIGRLTNKDQRSHGLNSNLNSNSVCDNESQDNIDQPKRRRRLMKQQNFAEMGVSSKCTYKGNERYKNVGIPKDKSDEEEMKLHDSCSEGESLGGFIVNSSNVDSDVSDKDTRTESEDSSDSGVDYKEIMSGLRRDCKHKMEWDFEADMLADFGKYPEICMKAVCALYRQQTSEEQSCKATLNLNGRGFSQCDAYRGSELAEFLTDGEPESDVKKSLEELLEFYPNGDELCRQLAIRYSKQLFAIYQNGEDLFFISPEPGGQC